MATTLLSIGQFMSPPWHRTGGTKEQPPCGGLAASVAPSEEAETFAVRLGGAMGCHGSTELCRQNLWLPNWKEMCQMIAVDDSFKYINNNNSASLNMYHLIASMLLLTIRLYWLI